MKNVSRILIKERFKLACTLLAVLLSVTLIDPLTYLAAQENSTASATADDEELTEEEKEEDLKFQKITEAQWKKKLTRQQYNVARKHDTETPFNNKYHNSKKDGVYVCICCGLPLFDSQTKFDSNTGWPSFYQPLKKKSVGTTVDKKLEFARTEVHCRRCNAHLGHVFNDAPQTPTGLRYCMNSASLNFLDRAASKKIDDRGNPIESDSSKSVTEKSESAKTDTAK